MVHMAHEWEVGIETYLLENPLLLLVVLLVLESVVNIDRRD